MTMTPPDCTCSALLTGFVGGPCPIHGSRETYDRLEQAEAARDRFRERAESAERQLADCQKALEQATTFTLNTDADPHEWITVELTCKAGQGPHKPPRDTWAVRGPMRRCLNADGEWEWEPQPSSRDDAFFARTRWPLEEAMERARAVLARLQERRDDE